MKKFIPIIIVTLCCFAVIMCSCSKNDDKTATVSGAGGSAFIKISQFSPAFRQVFNNRDSFNLFVNGVKLNGSFLTYGSLYPSSSNLYAAVPAGSAAIKITVNGINNPDSIALTTLTKTLTAGNYYSLMITDSLQNSSDGKQIFVQDNFSRSDTLHYSLRFAHAILNDTAGKNVDVFSTRQAANLFSNISPGTVTPFVAEAYYFVSDTLIVRRAGSSFELARLSTVAIPIGRERAYTLVYKGTPATITGTKGRSITYYPNQ